MVLHCVIANVLESGSEVSWFELQSCYCIHNQTNTHGKGIHSFNPLWVKKYPCSSPTTHTGWYDIKQRNINLHWFCTLIFCFMHLKPPPPQKNPEKTKQKTTEQQTQQKVFGIIVKKNYSFGEGVRLSWLYHCWDRLEYRGESLKTEELFCHLYFSEDCTF